MRLALNRIVSTLERAECEYSDAGIQTLRFGCLDTESIDVTLHQSVIDFDQFEHVIVTSPEATRHLITVIKEAWPQWPEGQNVWAVGYATSAVFQDEIFSVRCTHKSGSAFLIPEIEKELKKDSRVLVACGLRSGRQFQILNQYLATPLAYLELYRTFPTFPSGDLDEVTHILHGSASCIKAFFELDLGASHLIHIITSNRAKSHLPFGSRYYQIEAPTVERVLHAIRGETNVKL